MIVRYVPAKVVATYVMAVAAGTATAIVFALIGLGSALVGAVTALAVIIVMLLFGMLKRAARREPILSLDAAGLTVHLPGVGLIPWRNIRHWEAKGIAWVTGQRLIVDYVGAERAKFGFLAKLDWGVQSRRRGDGVRLILGFLDQTDTPLPALKAAIAQHVPGGTAARSLTVAAEWP